MGKMDIPNPWALTQGFFSWEPFCNFWNFSAQRGLFFFFFNIHKSTTYAGGLGPSSLGWRATDLHPSRMVLGSCNITFPIKVTNSLANSACGLECVAHSRSSMQSLWPRANPKPHLFHTPSPRAAAQPETQQVLTCPCGSRLAVHSHQNLGR